MENGEDIEQSPPGPKAWTYEGNPDMVLQVRANGPDLPGMTQMVGTDNFPNVSSESIVGSLNFIPSPGEGPDHPAQCQQEFLGGLLAGLTAMNQALQNGSSRLSGPPEYLYLLIKPTSKLFPWQLAQE